MNEKICKLLELYKAGKLGGEKMPEDENPGLDIHSRENYLYFTLPMALNYQRNSYKLWESANQTHKDNADCFLPECVVKIPLVELRENLLKYKTALQPEIWKTLCTTIHEQFDNDIRNLFIQEHFSVFRIKKHINENKSAFPYLSGKKILNYWLFVMEKYTDVKFFDRENITVAPDTHVIQASCKLGIIDESEKLLPNVQDIVSERWENILSETEYCPIDIHTPLWLWSRGKFEINI
ncbi:MAG: hypothetical protein FWF15_10625 [Oscillospiraceae bacterium]|nr:hypothetical protein [Oscillospiraceae bacterium]